MVLATPARNWLGYAKVSTNAPDRRSLKKSRFFHSTPSSAANHTQTHAPVQKITTHNNSFFAFDFIHPDTPKSIAPRDQATNPSTLLRPPEKPSCPTELHFPQRASLPPRPPATSTIALRTHHQNHHAQQLIFCVSTSSTLIHLKALLPATKQQIPLPPMTTQKAILSHRTSLSTKSFTTTPLPPQLQPLPFVPATETTTHNNLFFAFQLHSP